MEARGKIAPTLPLPNPTVSYWQDPPSDIADLRSTADLPNYADYVIVGSGISGACIAWNLLERDPSANVLMLEARQTSSGATGRNGGHTKAASYRTYLSHVRYNGLADAMKVVRLEQANIDATHAFAKEHGIACEAHPCNTVDIIYDEHSFKAGVEAVDQLKRDLGPEDPAAQYRIHNERETKEKFFVDGGGVVGSLEYAAGSISAYKFAIGILEICLATGLNLQTTTPVTAVTPVISSDGTNASKSRAAARWTVSTSRGPISTRTLILATNGYSGALLPQLVGNVVPFRGQVIASSAGTTLRDLVPQGLRTTYSFMYSRGYEYMIPRPYHSTSSDVPFDKQGDMIIGGGLGLLPNDGAGEFGNTDDTVVNEQNSTYLRQTLPTFFGRNWGEAEVKKEWTGIMGATKDGAPFVGQWPGAEGLFVTAGFNGHGMVLCMKCAEALVGMMFGETPVWFPESFKVSRERLEDGRFQGRAGMRADAEAHETGVNGSLAY